MKADEICGLVKAYGVAGIYDKSEEELRLMVCTLAKELDETRTTYLSATFPYRETHAETDWRILDLNPGMRMVWITKHVKRMAGTEFEQAIDENVMLVDRKIAPQMIDLLNSQMSIPD